MKTLRAIPLFFFAAVFLIHGPSASGADIEFLGPHEERLRLWTYEDNTAFCTLKTAAGEFQINTIARGLIREGKLEAPAENGTVEGDAAQVGDFIMKTRQDGDAVIIVSGASEIDPDPSGAYRRLDYPEILALARKRFQQSDKTLNTRYRRLIASLPGERTEALRKLQRAWIEYRDSMSEHQVLNDEEAEGDKTRGAAYWETMADLTNSRVEFFGVFAGAPPKDGFTGLWIDEFGGSLILRATDRGDEVAFEISVVRGPTFHTGQIEGVAGFTTMGKKRRAVFVDTDREAFLDGKPCRLEFIIDGNRVELKGENTGYYHGARAFFDGAYFHKPPAGAVKKQPDRG